MEKAPNKIFFNYGTVGLMGEPAYRAATDFLKEYYEVGPPEVLLAYEPYVDKLAQEVSRLLSCSEEEIVYIKNTTEGIFLASEALPLSPGDEVLVWANEYPATLLAWQKKRRDGITVSMVGGDNATLVDSLVAAISPQTKVITVAWAQHYDGFLPDLKRLGGICRERGIYLVVDGVQGVGVRAIDLTQTPVDILVCGGQKYMGAIVGIGFMYIRKEIIKDLKHIKVGIRSVETFDQESYTIRDTARRFEDGTINLLGIVALHAAVSHINATGIQHIQEKNLVLLEQYKSILKKNNIPFIDHICQGNIIALEVADPASLTAFLRGRSIYIKPMKDVARISFTHNSTKEDFERLVEAAVEWQHNEKRLREQVRVAQKVFY